MQPFHPYIDEYRRQMQNGAVPKAYQGLMHYLMDLRTHFQSNYPDYFVSGSLYAGYMDMSYFSIIPPALKQRGLKIAFVFLHATCHFEVWLAAANKQIQTRTWQQIKDSGWQQYRLVPSPRGADSILEHVLAETPDFSDLDALTGLIEEETGKFIADIEDFLSKISEKI